MALTLGGVASAETNDLRVLTTLGFNSQIRNRYWSPLIAHVENNGPARTLTLVVESAGQYTEQRLLFSRPIWLPAHSTRRVEFPILPDLREITDTQQGKVVVVCQVRLLDEKGRTVVKTDAMASPAPETAFQLFVADSRWPSFIFLKEQLTVGDKRIYARAIFNPQNLPRRPLYYSGADAMVLGDRGETDLTPLQWRALVEWVRAGGTLFVLPPAVRGDEPLAGMLPAQYFPSQLVETLPEIAPGVMFPNGVAFARLAVRDDAEVLWGTRDRPLIVARAEGLGRVVALAFDAGTEEMQRWPGALAFWQGLLAQVPRSFRNSDRMLERSGAVEGILSSMAGIKVLPRRVIMVYLLATAGGLVLVLLAFRFTRTPERGWPVAVSLAVVVAVGTVVAARIWKAQPSPFLAEVYVAQARSGATNLQVRAALGLFSPGEAAYTLTAADDRVAMRAGRSATTPPELFPIAYEDHLAITNLDVRANDVRLMYAVAPAPVTAAPAAEVWVDATGLNARVQLADGLADGFWKYHRFVLPTGDVAAGQVWERTGLTKSEGLFSDRLVQGGADEVRSRVRQVFFPEPAFDWAQPLNFDSRRYRAAFRGTESGPVFFGWDETPRVPVASIEPAVARRAVGLWAVEAPVQFRGPKLWLPRGILPLRLRNKSAATAEVGEGKFMGTRPITVVVEFTLPAGCPALDVQEATLVCEFRGSAFRPRLSVAPATVTGDDPENLAGWVALSGGPVYAVPQPARFWNPATQRLLVAVEVESAAGEGALAENVLMGLSSWQIRELDLELKGALR